jgi:integrase
MKKLTTAVVKTVSAPALIWDVRIPGLCLRAYPGGAKSFLLNYRVNGRERRITIGAFPTWSVEAARARAKELRREIDAGRDPAGEKRERREAPTVQNLLDRYVAEHLPTKGAKGRKVEYLKKAVQYRENDERRMLDEIGRRLGRHGKVADIHGGDIREMHRGITATRGPVRANRILAVASKAFSLALVPLSGENKPWRDQAQGNPCRGIARNHEESRGRLFSQVELAAISDALADYPGVSADCVRLIMLTGCRPSEAMHARWEEFDREPGYWVRPSAHTKQRREHRVPLAPPAMQLIERLGKKRTSEFVFPGQVPGEPLRALWHVWHYVRDHAKLDAHARLYDLRHSYASYAAGGGLSLPIIGRLLGHTQARTTQRYAGHLADDPLRDAVTKITNAITGAGKAGAEIVRIRKG